MNIPQISGLWFSSASRQLKQCFDRNGKIVDARCLDEGERIPFSRNSHFPAMSCSAGRRMRLA